VVLVVGMVAVAWWWSGMASEGGGAPATATAPVSGTLRLAQPNNRFFSKLDRNPSAPDAKVPADAVGGAADLRRVFDEYIASADPRRRRIAARAFDACVPAFLPAGAQTPSPEPLIRALPAQGRAEREAAYWSLFARCRGFLGEGRGRLENLHRQLQGDEEAREAGVRAQEDLLAGRVDRIESLVSQGLNAAEPPAVASLAGLAARLALERNPDASPDPALLRRAHAIDAALPWVACDLGLDCSASSLPALQLCAVQGLCEGDLGSRMAQRSGDTAEAGEIQQERERLLALIRSGRALTTTDLLP